MVCFDTGECEAALSMGKILLYGIIATFKHTIVMVRDTIVYRSNKPIQSYGPGRNPSSTNQDSVRT